MKEPSLIGQILSLVETTRHRASSATAFFLAIDRGDIVYCAKELTCHMATPTTADWEKMVTLVRYLWNRPRVQLWYKFQETPCQLETFSDPDCAGCRRTRRITTGGHTVAGSHLIKSVQNTSCCGTQFSGSRIVRLGESVRRNNGTHIDVQRLRHAYERSGTGRCERSPRHCDPTETGQIQASGHQLFVDPRESCQG